jgi:hypothetical protein
MPDLPWSHRTLWQMTLIGSAVGVQVVNTHHFEAATALNASITDDTLAIAEGGDLADDWLTSLKTAWLAAHGPDYTLNMVKVQCLERPGLFRHKLTPIERPQTTGNVGTAALSGAALSVAAVIRWRTPQAGKSHRGRTYVGPVPSNWLSAGLLNTTAAAAIATYGTAMVGRYGVGGSQYNVYGLTIYSRPYNEGEYAYPSRKGGIYHIEKPVDYAGNSTNVLASQLDSVLRSQRRREIGVGS